MTKLRKLKFTVLLSAQERRMIHALAAAKGVPVSVYIRLMIRERFAAHDAMRR